MGSHPKSVVENATLRALDSARRGGLEQLGRRALALERLLEISQRIALLDIHAALDAILHHVLALTGMRRAAVLWDTGDGRLEVQAAIDENGPQRDAGNFPFSSSITRQAFERGKVSSHRDLHDAPERSRPSVVSLRLRSAIAIPLRTRRATRGVLYVDSSEPSSAERCRETSILEAFGVQAAIALDNARLHDALRRDHFRLRRTDATALRFGELVYRSAAMDRVHEAVRLVAESDLTVLIRGESGTGKELVARAAHAGSARKTRRFVSLNVGALPDTTLESELFGHCRGAFSGATSDKEGLFEAANGGTLFLDEVGDASAAMQVKLLRVLEAGTFRRLGETRERRADVRLVAASHRDLGTEVRAGRFRQDLFFRINVFPILVPPLRERREDIALLAEHFIQRHAARLSRKVDSIAPSCRAALEEHSWPGNVRELENTVQRLLILSRGRCLVGRPNAVPGAAAVPEAKRPAPAGALTAPGTHRAARDLDDGAWPTLEDVEGDYIASVLRACDGNQSEAARRLGLGRSTLRRRLARHGLVADEDSGGS